MKHFVACFKRETRATFRGAQGYGLLGMFLIFAISNPVLTILTPMLMEALSDSFAELGMEVPQMAVNALASWSQFFDNISLVLIVFHILLSSIFTRDYHSGRLIIPVTKGLSRRALLLSKTAWLLILWTAGYALSVGVTYLINGILWDNGIVPHLTPVLLAWYLFGVWTIALMVFFSVVFRNSALVMLGTGGVVFICYLIGLLPRIGRYMPTALMDVSAIMPQSESSPLPLLTYLIPLGLAALAMGVSVPLFDKKRI